MSSADGAAQRAPLASSKPPRAAAAPQATRGWCHAGCAPPPAAAPPRRYGEAWAATSGADTLIRCAADGATLRAHSQLLSLASPRLRAALAPLPPAAWAAAAGPRGGAGGPAFALSLDARGPQVAAALDMIYAGADPSLQAHEPSWVSAVSQAARPAAFARQGAPAQRPAPFAGRGAC